MKTKLLLVVLVVLAVRPVFSQNTKDLYMPREFKQAYDIGTRSHEGIPGENYFQNRADYNIKVELLPDAKLLIGNELIAYKNNSPDSLSHIYITLYQNLYKKGEARDIDVDVVNIHNGVKIKSVKINGIKIESSSLSYYSTVMVFPVPNKISPNSETTIEIEWEQKIPLTALRRFGTYEESNFFMGYWYPKMNVYDDIVGWNTFAQGGNTELYSNYGDFVVEVTVPSEYNVWSSGLLQNTNEIFQDKYIKRINEASLSDEVIQIISEEDRVENRITKAGEKHKWKFKGEYLPDFAFAVSNKYLWDATSVKIANKRVLINAVYNKTSKNYRKVAELSRKSVDYYSNKIFAIPYPYPLLTAFNGENQGAEFPAMVNDQEYDNDFENTFVTTHEIAHTYFPFYVGINEQEYSWMDEGLATIIGISALAELMGTEEATILRQAGKEYHNKSRKFLVDIPLMIGTHNAGDYTYGFMTYGRPITAFSLLFDYLGKEIFYQAIREFLQQWKGKHATPYDLFYTFNKITNEDLGWFWNPWFFELGHADIGIGEVVHGENKTTVQIKNIGGFPIPVNLIAKYKDGTEKTVNTKMDIWKGGNRLYLIEIPKGNIKEIILDPNTPETYYDNNRKVY
ncbi:MAG: hypothetical protein DRI95_10650 [Bacteroidetes bacterium]|nr:MAG: hypothetical protein DRI95_10650 [Bacteroidota bacterium]